MATSTAPPVLSSYANEAIQSMAPETPTPLPEIVEALRGIGDLAGLSDQQLQWLAEHAKERVGPGGALIFREGEPACHMNIILRGETQVRRRKSGPAALFIGRAGQITGKLPYSRMKTYGGDGYSAGPFWVLDIHQDLFPAMLQAIPVLGQRSVSILLDRVREVTRMEQQTEKLAALGKLAANLAHELNNPASAAQRSAASLFGELRSYGDQKYQLGSMCISPEVSARLHEWVAQTRSECVAYPSQKWFPTDAPMAAADREDQILQRLNKYNVPDAWSIAPTLAEGPFSIEKLDEFVAIFPPEVLAPAMATYAASIRVERMAETILSSTARIFDLISAIKDYSYMDQAPIQQVDLAQSLEVTLSMFGSRLVDIKLELEFDPELKRIAAYGGELNQVWTALIENALDAMPQGGTLHLKTKLAGEFALIEVWDTGAGILPELKSRIFEPFFTTKAPGSGLGLGLDTAQRIVHKHSGFLTVQSKPGETCFQVRLPLDQAEAY